MRLAALTAGQPRGTGASRRPRASVLGFSSWPLSHDNGVPGVQADPVSVFRVPRSATAPIAPRMPCPETRAILPGTAAVVAQTSLNPQPLRVTTGRAHVHSENGQEDRLGT